MIKYSSLSTSYLVTEQLSVIESNPNAIEGVRLKSVKRTSGVMKSAHLRRA